MSPLPVRSRASWTPVASIRPWPLTASNRPGQVTHLNVAAAALDLRRTGALFDADGAMAGRRLHRRLGATDRDVAAAALDA